MGWNGLVDVNGLEWTYGLATGLEQTYRSGATQKVIRIKVTCGDWSYGLVVVQLRCGGSNSVLEAWWD
ncbi:hypothetical protein PanWU01x14_102280 [Parasponia andersonii]|uniref:Uncharacterized protein n=1 Tax=Parasponia andersonii TaxID=3476 RepID=A0A2P5D2R7_PARAD|nr:hypothetical protein PanWU01x14_102280 [Parasponia andersonii]